METIVGMISPKFVSDSSKKVEKEVRLNAIRLQDFWYKRLLDVILKGNGLLKILS